MKFKLHKLSVSDGKDVYDMLQHIGKNENGFINHCYDMSYSEFKSWLMRSDEISKGKCPETWLVQQSIYWLYANGSPVGVAKLRHNLTKSLEIEGGHIGYAIAFPHRNQGCCTALIGLTLQKCAALGIEEALVTISNTNKPSIKAALRNGGVVKKVSNGKHYIWLKTGV